MLEVIDKGATTDRHPVPLLFVHGAWHAAWCWDEYFLDWFAANGYRAIAVSLRGHGGSTTDKPVSRCSLADYVADVGAVADGLPTNPVLIGHSMGGFIVQKVLESRACPAGVLVASAPHNGALGYTLRLTRRYPLPMAKSVTTGDSLAPVRGTARARENFFSDEVAERDVERFAALLGPESRRVGLDAIVLLPRRSRVVTPLLVLGAENDRSIVPRWVRSTAKAYGTEAVIFPGLGHDMMLEPGWQAVAGRIDEWLSARDL